jgi:hypothetical protein
VLALLAVALAYGTYQLSQVNAGPADSPPEHYRGEPVPLNLSSTIATGFGGDVHPLLHGQTRLELAAHWVTDAKGQYAGKKMVLDGHYFFLDLKPARERQTYTERDFSAFLPEQLPAVGQLWAIDPNKVATFLRQFHNSPSMHLDSAGRRVGPDGAFAILRGMSPAYLDIAFRAHAEFDITSDLQEMPPGRAPVERAWYTPAYFSGEMIVNRAQGTVEYFRLWVPADRSLNVHYAFKHSGVFGVKMPSSNTRSWTSCLWPRTGSTSTSSTPIRTSWMYTLT